MEFFFLALCLVLLAMILLPFLRVESPPMPSSTKARTTIMEMLPSTLDGRAYELGTGWGGLARALGRHMPESQIVGYELSPLPWLLSRLMLALRGPDNVTLRFGDFNAVPLSDAALVACYLSPQLMAELAPKLKAELRPGTWVVSSTFALPGWTALTETRLDDIHATPIYLYRA